MPSPLPPPPTRPLIGRPSMINAAERQAILQKQREAALRRRNLQLRVAKVGEGPTTTGGWDLSTAKPPPPPPPPPSPPTTTSNRKETRTGASEHNVSDERREENYLDAEASIEERPYSNSINRRCNSPTPACDDPAPKQSASLSRESCSESSSSSSLSSDSSATLVSMDDASREEICVAPAPVKRIGKPNAFTEQKRKLQQQQTQQSKDKSEFSIANLGLSDTDAMKEFLTSPCPKEAGTLQCYVRRHKTGAKKSLFPEYRVYLKEGDIFLLTSKKRKNKKTSNYLISMGRNDFDKTSQNIVGKLRSNFLGTDFTIYDSGRNPDNTSAYFDERSDASIRSELGAIVYSSNLIGNRGPRQMQVCINKVDKKTGKSTKEWQPAHRDEEMIQCFKHRVPAALRHLIVLENKEPKWNQELAAHVLNFNGRVTQASVKNFQLIHSTSKSDDGKDEHVVLQFGRVAKDEFTLDFSWPMSPLQAFAIALSSCDAKLACD